jgi:hypothetical protein
VKYDVAASRHSQHRGEEPAGAGTPAPVAAKAASINAAQAHPLTWKTVVKRAVVLAVAGAAIYLVLPSLIAVLGAWPRLSTPDGRSGEQDEEQPGVPQVPAGTAGMSPSYLATDTSATQRHHRGRH